MVNVLFVCLGNICRSPMAEGVFRARVSEAGLSDRIAIDSAGTGDWHIGQPPDPRAQRSARQRGIDLSGLRARQAGSADFDRFDHVLAMDRANLADLARLCPAGREDRLRLFLDFAADTKGLDVPDPYYGGAAGFERVLDLVDAGARGLLDHIRRNGV